MIGWSHDTTEEGHLIEDPLQDELNCFFAEKQLDEGEEPVLSVVNMGGR